MSIRIPSCLSIILLCASPAFAQESRDSEATSTPASSAHLDPSSADMSGPDLLAHQPELSEDDDLGPTSLAAPIVLLSVGATGTPLLGWFAAFAHGDCGHHYDPVSDAETTCDGSPDAVSIGLGVGAVLSAGMAAAGLGMLVKRLKRRRGARLELAAAEPGWHLTPTGARLVW